MKRFLLYVTLTVGAFVFLYPFVWMLAASLKPEMEIAGFNPFSSHFMLENYRFVLRKIPILRGLGNSLLVSVIVTTSVVVFGSLVGYAPATYSRGCDGFQSGAWDDDDSGAAHADPSLHDDGQIWLGQFVPGPHCARNGE
jgi:ABC-type glycerol-3-phosphate transport system permease component